MTTEAEQSLVGWTQVIYGLHAFSLLTGLLGAATVVGAFLRAGRRSSRAS